MDVNELRRKVYKTIFDTCVKLDSKDVGGSAKVPENAEEIIGRIKETLNKT